MFQDGCKTAFLGWQICRVSVRFLAMGLGGLCGFCSLYLCSFVEARLASRSARHREHQMHPAVLGLWNLQAGLRRHVCEAMEST